LLLFSHGVRESALAEPRNTMATVKLPTRSTPRRVGIFFIFVSRRLVRRLRWRAVFS
jgi:hypothetical protein